MVFVPLLSKVERSYKYKCCYFVAQVVMTQTTRVTGHLHVFRCFYFKKSLSNSNSRYVRQFSSFPLQSSRWRVSTERRTYKNGLGSQTKKKRNNFNLLFFSCWPKIVSQYFVPKTGLFSVSYVVIFVHDNNYRMSRLEKYVGSFPE